MGIQNRFSDNDPYTQTVQTISANNNQAALNVAFAENNHLRATPASLQPDALTMNLANPVPNVTIVGNDTIGAALGNVGQSIAVIGETGGDGDGGGECFLGNTRVSLWYGVQMPFSKLFTTKEEWQRGAHAFDENDHQVPAEIVGVFETTTYEYLHVVFADGTADDVIAEHRYYVGNGEYAEIGKLLGHCVVTGDEYDPQRLSVTGIHRVQVPEGISVYNMHIKKYHNYIANGRRVHNLKRLTSQIAEQ